MTWEQITVLASAIINRKLREYGADEDGSPAPNKNRGPGQHIQLEDVVDGKVPEGLLPFALERKVV